MNLTTALFGLAPGINEVPEGQGPEVEIPEIEADQDPIDGFEAEKYEGHWNGEIQARAFVSAHRIGESVRQELGLPDEGVVAIYDMKVSPETNGVFVTMDDAGWETWEFLVSVEQGDSPPEVTAVITSELYTGGLFDLFDPSEDWDRTALEHAILVDVELLSDAARGGLEAEVQYVLAAPREESERSQGDFHDFGRWGIAAPPPIESPWAMFSMYATTRPDQGSSVGSMTRSGAHLPEGAVDLGEGWEMRVTWYQNAPWGELD
jgi:hypothetical protein